MDFVNDKGVQKAKQMANKEEKKKREIKGRETSLSFPMQSCKN